jgi:hypothetical protein
MSGDDEDKSYIDKIDDFMTNVLRYSEDEDDEEQTQQDTSDPTPAPQEMPTMAPGDDDEHEHVDLPDVSSDEAHDYVEALFEYSTPAEMMELIAEYPELYLYLVENYKKTRDGKDIYLPNLLNIVQSRERGLLHIKFKVDDNGKWYQVGFNDPKYTDEDVYNEFTTRVRVALISDPVERQRQIALLNGVDLDEARRQKQEQRERLERERRENMKFEIADHGQSKLDKFLKRDQKSLQGVCPAYLDDTAHLLQAAKNDCVAAQQPSERACDDNNTSEDTSTTSSAYHHDGCFCDDDDQCAGTCDDDDDNDHCDLMQFIATEPHLNCIPEKDQCCAAATTATATATTGQKQSCTVALQALNDLKATMELYIQHVGAIVKETTTTTQCATNGGSCCSCTDKTQ